VASQPQTLHRKTRTSYKVRTAKRPARYFSPVTAGRGRARVEAKVFADLVRREVLTHEEARSGIAFSDAQAKFLAAASSETERAKIVAASLKFRSQVLAAFDEKMKRRAVPVAPEVKLSADSAPNAAPFDPLRFATPVTIPNA
jgi:hypothetical protein